MAERKPISSRDRRAGQASIEFALVYAAVGIPLIFGGLFLADLLWVWHSIVELTRDGARYAATHCYTDSTGSNVIQYMQDNIPPNLQIQQFQAGGTAMINVVYSSIDLNTGLLDPFSCASNSTACVPDTVAVSVTNYQFQPYATLLKSITMPSFLTNQAIASAGYDETGQPAQCP